MPNSDRFGLLRKLLKALGPKDEAVDEIVDRIIELLTGERKDEGTEERYPYRLRDDFLTAAEHSFYMVLKQAVEETVVICPKVSLSDVFTAKSSDYGEYRTHTNKIDRKHTDFLLCDPKTMRPLAGIASVRGARPGRPIARRWRSHQLADSRSRSSFLNTGSPMEGG